MDKRKNGANRGRKDPISESVRRKVKKKEIKRRRSRVVDEQNDRISKNASLRRALDDRRTRRNRRSSRRFSLRMQRMLGLLFVLIFAVAIFLVYRIGRLNFTDGTRYAKKVLGQSTYVNSTVPYKRGDILDRNGTVLATSEKQYKISVDPSYILLKDESGEFPNKEHAINVITDFFGYDRAEFEKTLEDNKNKQYMVIEKAVSAQKKKELDDYISDYEKKVKDETKTSIKVRGIVSEVSYKRKYPLSTVGSTVVGFASVNDKGEETGYGLEGYYNDVLKGEEGRTFGYYDNELNLVSKTIEPKDGNKIVTTIDSNLQRITEEHLLKFNEEIGCSNCAVVLADPNTMEILAMASSNGIYDLNNPTDLSRYYSKEDIEKLNEDGNQDMLVECRNEMWRNRCVTDIFEPGSTFKPFVVSGGLMENVLKGNEKYICDGSETIAGRKIHCANRNGHGNITLEQAVMYSCNDALMAIGKAMGSEMLAKYSELFGFGQKTGIDVVGEGVGIVRKAEDLGPVELATTSFGQGVNVTMIQMVTAFSSLINGGYYYKPKLVKQVLNSNGAVVEDIEPVLVKQTVSRDVSETLKKYMYATVEHGTAKYAQVEGYTVGGKTGTAQKITKTEDGKLVRDDVNYLVSFIGFAPANNPEVVIYAIVDEPKVEKQSNSKYAQELAAGILKDILPFLGVYPSDNTQPQYYDPDDYDNTENIYKPLPEKPDDPDKTDDPTTDDPTTDDPTTDDPTTDDPTTDDPTTDDPTTDDPTTDDPTTDDPTTDDPTTDDPTTDDPTTDDPTADDPANLDIPEDELDYGVLDPDIL